jgi:hypothetical protein
VNVAGRYIGEGYISQLTHSLFLVPEILSNMVARQDGGTALKLSGLSHRVGGVPLLLK